MATITIDGETQTKSLTELEALLSSPDREKRRTAAEAMDVAREKAAPQFAASLNAIKGEALTLSKRRKWHSPLDWSLFISAIDREILAAMFAAAESVHGDFIATCRPRRACSGSSRWRILTLPRRSAPIRRK